MNKELQDYYEERFSTFATKGWVDFIEDMKALQQPLLNIKSIKTEQELQFRKGQLDILDLIIGLEITSEESYRTLKEE